MEIPDQAERASHLLFDLPTRVGLAALLDGADADEAQLHGREAAGRVSTEAPDFAALMDDLTFNIAPLGDLQTGDVQTPTRAAWGRRTAVPAPLAGPGDLVVLVGLGDVPLGTARAMAASVGAAEVRCAGAQAAASPGDDREPVADRRTALAARARGVERGCSTFVAFGLPRTGPDAASVAAVCSLRADQLWVVVDAGRKPEDTARWVGAIAAATPVHALAVEGRDGTASPATVNELGLPVGWMDGVPAAAPKL